MTDSETLHSLQTLQRPWINHNFPNHKPWHPLLGLVEEFGEFAAAGTDADRADAVADVMIFAADYCTSMGWKLSDIWTESNSAEIINGVQSVKERLETAVLINLGKLCHAHLKQVQGIRVEEDWTIEGRLALAKLFALLREMSGVDAVAAAKRVWDGVVSKRDWVRNPVNG